MGAWQMNADDSASDASLQGGMNANLRARLQHYS